jgi:hypothetical protein
VSDNNDNSNNTQPPVSDLAALFAPKPVPSEPVLSEHDLSVLWGVARLSGVEFEGLVKDLGGTSPAAIALRRLLGLSQGPAPARRGRPLGRMEFEVFAIVEDMKARGLSQSEAIGQTPGILKKRGHVSPSSTGIYSKSRVRSLYAKARDAYNAT